MTVVKHEWLWVVLLAVWGMGERGDDRGRLGGVGAADGRGFGIAIARDEMGDRDLIGLFNQEFPILVYEY